MTDAPNTTDPDDADTQRSDLGREYGRTDPAVDEPTEAGRADRGREYGRTDVDATGTDPDITSDTGH